MSTAVDIVIIIWGLITILTTIVVLLIATSLFFTVRNLVGTVNELVNTNVKPTMESTEQSAVNVAGTTQFLGDTLVSPIIRVISVSSGLRRGIGVFTGVSSRPRGNGER
jgi:hypothetical protein